MDKELLDFLVYWQSYCEKQQNRRNSVMLAWIVIGVCIGFFGGMMVGYFAFSPKFEK